MPLTVRPCASYDDVAAIEATIPSGMAEMHRQRFELADGSTYLLAWVNGVAVGCALVTPESKYAEIRRDLGRLPEVNGLHVQTPWQRQGVATALLEAASTYARASGGARLGLAVELTNDSAARLYEAAGFADAGHPVTDVWTWYDDAGAAHVQRDPCVYWVRSLA